jgi:hypothetical protein
MSRYTRLRIERTNDGFPTPVELELSVRRVECRSGLKVYVALYAKRMGDVNGIRPRKRRKKE